MARCVRFALFAALLGTVLAARAQEEPSLGGFRLSEFPAAGAPPIFKLVDAGAEPRRELRYRLAAGSTHKLVMTLRMSLAFEVDGRGAPPSKAPAMRMIFECRVTEADDRQARVDLTMPEPPELFETEDVAPPMLEAMNKSLKQLSFIRGHVAITNRGVVRDARIEVGPGLDQGAAQMIQSMQQSMEQTSVPLPEEALGPGAQWKMLHRVQGSGVTVYQVGSFSLLRIEGPVATMAVTVEQFAPKQEMPLPEKAAPARAELVLMQGRGEGHMAVDLGSPVPRSSASIDSTIAINVRAEGKTLQMRMNNHMQVQIEPGTP